MRLKLICLILVNVVFACFALHAQKNILLIIADDVSPDYFGAYSTNTDTATAPNINALIRSGIKFTKVWSTPVCSPTRASVFTGRFPFRTGVGEVISNMSTPQLDTAEWSIAKLLKWYAPQKYNTANVGKWHLHTASISQRSFPNKMGYDFYAGNFSGALTDFYYYPIIINGSVDTVKKYATTQTVDHAIGWMDTMNASKPFFLWLAFNAPHSPYHLPPSSLCNTTGLSGTSGDITQNPQKYFKAAIEALDTEIGRMLQYLKTKNMLDSTVVIFMGDNGNAFKVAQVPDKSKSKETLYNYGVNVPLSITGPGIINPGRASDQLVNICDLFPTIAEIAGYTNWSSVIPSGKKIDGRSLTPILKNNSIVHRNWIFSEQFKTTPDTADGKTIRNFEYQLIRWANGKEAFYNLKSDVYEDTNKLQFTLSTAEREQYNMLCDSLNSLIGNSTWCTPKSKLSLQSNTGFIWIDENYIHIRADLGIKSIMIFNTQGRMVYRTNSKSGIHKSELSFYSGLYFVRAIDESGGMHECKIMME